MLTARILFLDIDDVLCLKGRAFDVFDAWAGVHDDPAQVWSSAFSPTALQALQSVLADEDVRVVVSSSWRRSFGIADFRVLLRACGAGFVADRLHVDWRTGVLDDRLSEIRDWLARHRDAELSWAVLDDTTSGYSLAQWQRANPQHPDAQRIVLCDADVGLTAEFAQRVQLALLQPMTGRPLP